MTYEYNNRIEMYNYKLSERHLILSNIESVVRPYGLTITIGSHGGVILYWTQYTKAQIVSHDVDANKTKVIRTENPQLLEIKMFSKKRQPSGSGCKESECVDFCFITPQGDKCGCRDGFMLDSDLHSCKLNPDWRHPR